MAIINTNIPAMNSHRAALRQGYSQATASERLTSGQRINRAADDAAGLAISEGLRNQIRGMDQAQRNVQDGISLIQTTEGALEEVHRVLERVRGLTVQGANDTYETQSRLHIWGEVDEMLAEVERIARETHFNGLYVLQGSEADIPNTYDPLVLNIQQGANSTQMLPIVLYPMTLLGLGLYTYSDDFFQGAVDNSGEVISHLIEAMDEAVRTVSAQRAHLGAQQNALAHTYNRLGVASENASAANSRIRDADMALEMMNLTKANILGQASFSMLAHANLMPQTTLELLQ